MMQISKQQSHNQVDAALPLPTASLYTKILNRQVQSSANNRQGEVSRKFNSTMQQQQPASQFQHPRDMQLVLNKNGNIIGPVKGLRDLLTLPPAFNKDELPSTTKVQIIKKQILQFPRSDSVMSNASAYPVLQNGASKVVRLIRGEGGGTLNLNETSRTMMQSTLKGISTDNSFIRKIQTPQVFKGKIKVTKKTSILKGIKAPPPVLTKFQ